MLWYGDRELTIIFSDRPCLTMRYATPGMTEKELTAVAKYPFVNHKDLQVRLTDYKKNKIYDFSIPKGYAWDGATIPRMFWRLIGSKTDPAFLIPSLIHDVLCENHKYVENDRNFADKVFERLLYVSNVPPLNRFLMFGSVEIYQMICGKWNASTGKGGNK